MKYILSAVLLSLAGFAHASTVITCATDSSSAAVVVQDGQPGEFSLLITINDSKVCGALGLECPVSIPAKSQSNGILAIPGEYASGVALLQDSGGMKLSTASINREQGRIEIGAANYFFNPGQCR